VGATVGRRNKGGKVSAGSAGVNGAQGRKKEGPENQKTPQRSFWKRRKKNGKAVEITEGGTPPGKNAFRKNIGLYDLKGDKCVAAEKGPRWMTRGASCLQGLGSRRWP